MTKGHPAGAALVVLRVCGGSALAGLEPALRLVDHVDPALAAHDAAVAVAVLQRPEGIANLHGALSFACGDGARPG